MPDDGNADEGADEGAEEDKDKAEEGADPSFESLLEGWIEGVDPASGLTYYYNEEMGVSSWDRPLTADKDKEFGSQPYPLRGIPKQESHM